jgi:hypothetical protein
MNIRVSRIITKNIISHVDDLDMVLYLMLDIFVVMW